MEAQGKLQAEKKFDPNPLLAMPTIMWSCEVVSLGHIGGGAREKALMPNTLRFS
jgi:hypothetical protein